MFKFYVTTTKQFSAEDISLLSDSNPHFTAPSISTTLQPVINKLGKFDKFRYYAIFKTLVFPIKPHPL